MTRPWKWGLGTALVALAGLCVATLWVLSSATLATGKHTVDGLHAPVSLFRDHWGVPHIFAETDEDACFALGWAHAEDRLWQMETMRRSSAGRLAEILGPSALASDRFMRTLGLYRLAEGEYATLDGATRRKFDAYARGVNAWLSLRSGALPPEFLLLRYKPEPWAPADSLVWLKLMALRLSGDHRTELLRARLGQTLSAQQLHDLWPDEPERGPTTLSVFPIGPDAGMLARLTAVLPDGAGQPFGASNAWVVAGARTATGKPILANDPHLGFALPTPWYLARIVTPTSELAGATSPGFPALVLGHNARIAWGITSSHIDVEDVFLERVDPDDPARYEAPDGRPPFAIREERIAVRDAPAETLRVRSTRHGPVISDLSGVAVPGAGPDERRTPVAALAATYLAEGDQTAEAVFALNKAADWHGFASAAERTTAPQQNVFYADVDGHIGFVSAGRIPLRPAGGGWTPVPGWSQDFDWSGFIPLEGAPKAFDPPSGRLVNANNRPVPVSDEWPIAGTWDSGFRAARIEERLAESAAQTIEGTAALQRDSVSLMARRLLPMMLAQLPKFERHAEVVALLQDWDGTMSSNRPEPLIFAAWLRELVRALCQDELGPAFDQYWDYRPRFVEVALTARTAWCDDVGTPAAEDCPSRLQAALEEALRDLSAQLGSDVRAWRWGDLHRALFEHPFWLRVPVVGGFASTAFGMDGGNDTINRAASRLSNPNSPFAAVHGAGYRGVYDLSDLGNSRMILATGQSGNPLSRHYRDMTPLWLDGRGIRLDADKKELARNAEATLLLLPSSQPRRP